MDLSGDFKSPGEKGTALPVSFEGGPAEIARTAPQGLDKGYLAKCMETTNGRLCLKCEKNNLKVDFNLSLKKN